MRRRRAFTLIETVVTSGVLLLMLSLATLAVMSYLRSYRQFTQQSTRLRLVAKTLDVACVRLRSAHALTGPIPTSLEQPLNYQARDGSAHTLQLVNGKLLDQTPAGPAVVLGRVSRIEALQQKQFLVLRAWVEGESLPLETQISLRGVRRL